METRVFNLLFLSVLPNDKCEPAFVENKFFKATLVDFLKHDDQKSAPQDLLCFETEFDQQEAKIQQVSTERLSQFHVTGNHLERCLESNPDDQFDSKPAEKQLSQPVESSNSNQTIEKLDSKPATNAFLKNKNFNMKSTKSHVLRNKKLY